ncbi:mitochondrial import receptor subunit tom-20 [Xylariaceae sp. FL0255]|nr:mitochondrial import receptor subunit tom-20 [Xylariaceae sp. FL0255]
MVQNTTILSISAATAATGLLAYAVYFDYQRRKDPTFRRQLRRQERRQARVEKEEAASQSKQKRREIHEAVEAAAAEGFPTGPEKESYFMEWVQQGELMASDPSRTLECALAFYKALKVYPAPQELIQIYDKTVDKRVIDVLAEMIAYDSTMDLSNMGITPEAAAAQRTVNISDLPTAGLD